MKTIKLTSFPPLIFDHPVYCNDENCGCYYLRPSVCYLFDRVHLDRNHIYFEKYHECKEHYQLSKRQAKEMNQFIFNHSGGNITAHERRLIETTWNAARQNKEE